MTSGSTYLVLGLGAGAATALVSVSPPILITAVAGLALFGAFGQAITTALEEPQHRIVAVVTFLVVASGIPIAGDRVGVLGTRRRRDRDALDDEGQTCAPSLRSMTRSAPAAILASWVDMMAATPWWCTRDEISVIIAAAVRESS